MTPDTLPGVGGAVKRTVARMRLMAGHLSRQRMIIFLTLTFCGAVGATFWHMSRLSSKLVESAALQGTILYADSLTELSTFYSEQIVDRVKAHGIDITHDYAGKKGAIPIPPTFTVEFGKHIGAKIPGMQIRLYSADPFPSRKDSGPRDSFEKEALVQLAKQPEKPFYRFENFQGRPSLRYATAVRLKTGCVACHNVHPDSSKTDWKDGDMGGVQEIIRPLDNTVADTRAGLNGTFVLLSAIGLLGLCGLALVIDRMRRNSEELEQRVAERTATEARLLALRDVNVAITSTLDLRSVLTMLLETIDAVLPNMALQIWLVDRQSGQVERAACLNLDEADWKGRKLKGTPALVKEAMSTRTPAMARNVQTDPRTADSEYFRRQRVISYLGIPLVVKERALGVLVFLTRKEHQFTNEEIEFLTTLAGQAAIAIDNSQLYEQSRIQAVELARTNEDLKRKEEIQALLKEINQDITRLDIDALLKKVTESVRAILKVDVSDARVLVEGRWKLTGIAGIDPKLLTSGRSGSGRGPAGWIQQHGKPLVIPDLSRTNIPTGTTMKSLGLRSYVGVPLFSRGGAVIGVLRGLSYQPREFTQEEVELLQQLANGSGVALENARLLEQIKKQSTELEKSNSAKDEFLEVMARQKEELTRLNAGLECEIAERGRARAELAAKNRDLETLLYVTSHDLREPLRAIENFSRMIHERYRERLDDKGQDFLRRVIMGSQRLTHLLDDILMLSRSQRMGAPNEVVDGESIVLESMKRLEGKINASGARIEVAKDFGGLRVDKVWATQAVYNLIANALKFTRDGERPVVEVVPHRPNGSDSAVIGIAVRDRGPGIPPEHAERIFQLFQRAVGREVEGTGAGLAIVRQIAERHGGHAWVKAREGGGSEFVITFGQNETADGENNNGHAAYGTPLS